MNVAFGQPTLHRRGIPPVALRGFIERAARSGRAFAGAHFSRVLCAIFGEFVARLI